MHFRDRWKTAALGDGSGLDRQELERLNSLVDVRIEHLSAQLAKLTEFAKLAQMGHVRLASYALKLFSMVGMCLLHIVLKVYSLFCSMCSAVKIVVVGRMFRPTPGKEGFGSVLRRRPSKLVDPVT